MRRLGYFAVLWMVGIASAIHADPLRLDKPGKKIRFLSLAEARAIALENGTIGQLSLLFPGVGLDSSITVPKGDDPIRVRVLSIPSSKDLVVAGIPRGPRSAELERNINQMLLNVETAYWNLYGSYWQLYSREEALRLAQETWKITEAQYKVGKLSRAALAQAEGQYDLFRSQRLAALDTVLDNERQLRAMLGMRIKDGTRLVPSDAPTLVEKKPNWKAGLRSAMKNRPELQMARQDVQLANCNAAIAEETAEYIPTVDELRQAKLQLARAELVLQDQELKTERYLGLWYRRMSSAYSQIKAARAQCEAFATQLGIRTERYRAGANEPNTSMPMTLNLLLEAQRFWAESLATECQAIVTYNNALTGWAFAKGEIMKHAHVQLTEEAPDDSAEVSAVEREHKRTQRHVRRVPGALAVQPDDRGKPARCPIWVLGAGENAKTIPSLPALWKFYPPLKEVGEVQTGLIEGRGVH
jgi:hypothetical protein